jgi:hypothetical protein
MVQLNLLSQQRVNCWDTHFQWFYLYLGQWWNHTTCSTRKNRLLGYFYFQTLTCAWDNDGTTLQPAAPEKKSELLGYFLNTSTWLDNDGWLNLMQPKKVAGYFTFNTSTCTWDNDGTAQPAAPTKWTVGILLLSTIQLVRGCDGTATNLKEWTVGILLLSTIQLVLGTMMELHSTRKSELLLGILSLSTIQLVLGIMMER